MPLNTDIDKKDSMMYIGIIVPEHQYTNKKIKETNYDK